jgi:hypothetical protein
MQQILKDNRHQLVNMPKLLSMELNQVYLLQWSWFRFHVLLYWIKIRTTGKISFSLMSDKYSKSYASMRMFLSFVYLYETITQDSVMWLGKSTDVTDPRNRIRSPCIHCTDRHQFNYHTITAIKAVVTYWTANRTLLKHERALLAQISLIARCTRYNIMW